MLAIASMSELHRQMLRFERRWWVRPGAKVQAIWTELGLGVLEYYRILNQVIETSAALVFDPELVYRLRRLRDRAVSRRGRPA